MSTVIVSERATKVFESRGLNGQEQQVEKIKVAAALLFDQIDAISCPPGTDAGRLAALAKTKLELTVMCAVKALSRNY